MRPRTPRHRPFRAATALAVAAATWGPPLTAQADEAVAEIEWGDGGHHERSLRIAPGKFAELCGALAAGVSVPWRFEADQPLDFNIHFHLGKDVRYPAREAQVRRAEGTLLADIVQDYCWMWTNKSAAVANLKVELTRRP